MADKWLGARRAVLVGGIIIASGHFSMAVPTTFTFYLGLTLIAIGTGFLKPNVTTMVGELYEEGDTRRDAGFSIFYMGINTGAVLAPIVVGWIAQRDSFRHMLSSMGFDPAKSWHWAFSAAGFFMLLGLIQYVAGGKRLGDVGKRLSKKPLTDIAKVLDAGREVKAQGSDVLTLALSVIGGVLGFIGGYTWGGAGYVGGLFPCVMFLFLGYILGTVRGLDREGILRVAVIGILFVFSVVFWMSFEQAATSLTLFADKLTHLEIFGFHIESSWYQSVEPVFVVLLAPVFALVWIKLGKREPASPTKFAVALLFGAIAFGIVSFASTLVPGTAGKELSELQKVGPLWLVAVYFFQSLGELCISPVGLSTVSKLAPGRLVGLMMGVWFLSISIGDFIAGIMGGNFDASKEGALLKSFGVVALISMIAAMVLAALTPLIKKMMPKTEQAKT